METELKIQFPNIVVYDLEPNTYIGVFKNDQNKNIFAQFHVPNYPNSKQLSFKTSLEFPDQFRKSLELNSETLTFVEYLKLFNQLLCKVNDTPKFNVDQFRAFWSEFKVLKTKFPDERFSFENELLTIIHYDDFAVKNEVAIKLNFTNAELGLYTVESHSFPETSAPLFSKPSNLIEIHAQFLCYVKSLASFHDLMQRIDSLCWVTAPLNPTPADNFRTIVISDNFVSIKIIFDAWHLEKIPEFKFYGPSHAIDIHRVNLSDNIGNWDPNNDILQNILNILDLPFFPLKQSENCSENADIILYDQESECCICFSYYYNKQIPDVVCEFESCRKQFHNACLLEWLSMLPSFVLMFGSISGNCPNCEKMISCKVGET